MSIWKPVKDDYYGGRITTLNVKEFEDGTLGVAGSIELDGKTWRMAVKVQASRPIGEVLEALDAWARERFQGFQRTGR